MSDQQRRGHVRFVTAALDRVPIVTITLTPSSPTLMSGQWAVAQRVIQELHGVAYARLDGDRKIVVALTKEPDHYRAAVVKAAAQHICHMSRIQIVGVVTEQVAG